MRNITENELQEILRKHNLWLNGECGERANLSGADMFGADLSRADLRWADLRWADLSRANLGGADMFGADLNGADLNGANLSEADMFGADLRWADLSRANLGGANLNRADLNGADLNGANLSEADMFGADLNGADLNGANLNRADLNGADLNGANLSGAKLSGAKLSGAKHIPYIPLACPEEGSFIGFKKAYADLLGLDPVIVRLLVLEDAKRSSATSNKCRCSKAKVLDIQEFDGHGAGVIAYSSYDRTFKYKIGEVVEVKDFDENRFNECAPGIHFFINRQDAVNY